MGTGLHPEARPSNILIHVNCRIVFDVNNLELHLDFVLDLIKQKYYFFFEGLNKKKGKPSACSRCAQQFSHRSNLIRHAANCKKCKEDTIVTLQGVIVNERAPEPPPSRDSSCTLPTKKRRLQISSCFFI